MTRYSLLVLLVVCAINVNGQAKYPAPVEGDYKVTNFEFESKEVLSEMNLHYFTMGTPQKDEKGQTTNAVIVMHGTTGTGQQFINDRFAGNLFGPGQLLDATKYYIIMPDGIGHGKSSKPSNGMHMKFPRYTYNDMVK